MDLDLLVLDVICLSWRSHGVGDLQWHYQFPVDLPNYHSIQNFHVFQDVRTVVCLLQEPKLSIMSRKAQKTAEALEALKIFLK